MDYLWKLQVSIAVRVLERCRDQATDNGDAAGASVFEWAAAALRPEVSEPWPSKAYYPFSDVRYDPSKGLILPPELTQ